VREKALFVSPYEGVLVEWSGEPVEAFGNYINAPTLMGVGVLHFIIGVGGGKTEPPLYVSVIEIISKLTGSLLASLMKIHLKKSSN
jgi:hypothetical protein